MCEYRYLELKKNDSRPSWESIFMTLAFVLAERSHDIETKVGCVITNNHNIILGTGINGYPSGIDDADLPKTRPGKHDYKIIHSEENAILNCWTKPDNGIAYITCAPCFSCLIRMYQFGIRTIYYSTLYLPVSANKKDEEMRQDFVLRTGRQLKLIPTKFDKGILNAVVKRLDSYELPK